MDRDSFIVLVETEDIYEVTAKNFEKRLDTLSYDLKQLLPKGKKNNNNNNKKTIN